MAILRGGIIGYGFIAANGHAPVYVKRDDVEIAAIADLCPRGSPLRNAISERRGYTQAQRN